MHQNPSPIRRLKKTGNTTENRGIKNLNRKDKDEF